MEKELLPDVDRINPPGGLRLAVGGQAVDAVDVTKFLTAKGRKKIRKSEFSGRETLTLLELAKAGIRKNEIVKGERQDLEVQGFFTGRNLSETAVKRLTGLQDDGTTVGGVSATEALEKETQRTFDVQKQLDEVADLATEGLVGQAKQFTQGQALREAVVSGDFSNPVVSEALRGVSQLFGAQQAARGRGGLGFGTDDLLQAQGGLQTALGVADQISAGGLGGVQSGFGLIGTSNPFLTPSGAFQLQQSALDTTRFNTLTGFSIAAGQRSLRNLEQQADVNRGIGIAAAIFGGQQQERRNTFLQDLLTSRNNRNNNNDGLLS